MRPRGSPPASEQEERLNQLSSKNAAAPEPLAAANLYRACDPAGLGFGSTEEAKPLEGVIGQDRALEALRLGARVGKPGFNLFVTGPNALGIRESVSAILSREARGRPEPPDWIYVNNFAAADRPVAIELPPGRARDRAAQDRAVVGSEEQRR